MTSRRSKAKRNEEPARGRRKISPEKVENPNHRLKQLAQEIVEKIDAGELNYLEAGSQALAGSTERALRDNLNAIAGAHLAETILLRYRRHELGAGMRELVEDTRRYVEKSVIEERLSRSRLLPSIREALKLSFEGGGKQAVEETLASINSSLQAHGCQVGLGQGEGLVKDRPESFAIVFQHIPAASPIAVGWISF